MERFVRFSTTDLPPVEIDSLFKGVLSVEYLDETSENIITLVSDDYSVISNYSWKQLSGDTVTFTVSNDFKSISFNNPDFSLTKIFGLTLIIKNSPQLYTLTATVFKPSLGEGWQFDSGSFVLTDTNSYIIFEDN